ncbi:MAG: hypothetical protein HKN68_03220 [Saprospiraceae bacterium]|nr:hypothetical protein [Saprospiraceae bacterium]
MNDDKNITSKDELDDMSASQEAETSKVEHEKKKKKKKKNQKKKVVKDPFESYDPRGVQTLFRTISRNHYNLLRMVDVKASIILTMNSIMISLIMGAMFVTPESQKAALEIGFRVIILFSVISMVFALISMLPHKYLGKSFKESKYNGTLYAGNFSSKSLSEFESSFKEVISKGYNLYDEMIHDLYFLGKVIEKKQRMTVFSVGIFLIGLIIGIIINMTNGLGMFHS